MKIKDEPTIQYNPYGTIGYDSHLRKLNSVGGRPRDYGMVIKTDIESERNPLAQPNQVIKGTLTTYHLDIKGTTTFQNGTVTSNMYLTDNGGTARLVISYGTNNFYFQPAGTI